MNAAASRATAAPRLSPADWDKLRREFHHSLLADTSLSALADNIDGCRWPVKGPAETPSPYIALDHAAAIARLQAVGQPPSALDKLAEILRATLAFDESFGEMVHVAGKAEAGHDPVPRNLERLGIPADFPVELCNLKPGTLEFCQREHIAVLSDFLSFSRGASRSVIIGGEFRDLLNAVTHIDETVVARYLPFRPKDSGLHLLEAVAHLARDLEPARRDQLVAGRADALPSATRARLDRLARHFDNQLRELRAAHAAGTPVTRLVAALDDIALEPVVAALLSPLLAPVVAPAAAPAPAEPAAPAPRASRPGLLRRMFGLGRA